MSDIIDVIFVQPSLVDHPWGIRQNLIHPPTMSDGLASLGVCHGGCRLVRCAEGVRAYPNEKLDAGKGELGLTELKSVTATHELRH